MLLWLYKSLSLFCVTDYTFQLTFSYLVSLRSSLIVAFHLYLSLPSCLFPLRGLGMFIPSEHVMNTNAVLTSLSDVCGHFHSSTVTVSLSLTHTCTRARACTHTYTYQSIVLVFCINMLNYHVTICRKSRRDLFLSLHWSSYGSWKVTFWVSCWL